MENPAQFAIRNAMKISPAELNELPAILELQKAAFQSEAALYNNPSIPPLIETLAEMEKVFAAGVVFKAEVDGEIAGTVRVTLDGKTVHVARLAVKPEFRKRGIGKALLLKCETVFPPATRCELFTGSKSENNIRLYEATGYRRFKEEPVGAGVSLVYMEKVLR